MRDFSHGGDKSAFAKRVGVKASKIVDFSTSINPYPPKIDLDPKKLDLASYPDPRYTKLKTALAKHLQTKADYVTLFHGASDAIKSLLQSHEGSVTIYAPAYSEYERFAKDVTLINRFDTIWEAPKRGSLVIFVNPSTPDGKHYELEELLHMWQVLECRVLIDESFLAFTKKPSAVEFVEKYTNLMVLTSLTKFYACAGVRVGLLISKGDAPQSAAWSISTFDAHYILQALADSGFKARTYDALKKDKKRLLKILDRSEFVDFVYPSDANFLLVKLKEIDAKKLQKRCDKRAIMIRNCENFSFLDNQHIRLAVRPKKELKKLKKVFRA